MVEGTDTITLDDIPANICNVKHATHYYKALPSNMCPEKPE